MPRHPTPRSFDPLPRRPPSEGEPVTVNVRTLPPDVVIPLHRHPWAQLAYPIRGAIRICAAGTAWIVPANRAVWIPPEIDHDVAVLGAVELRTLYITSGSAPLPLNACTVVDISPLMRSLCEAIAEGRGDTRHQLMMQLALEEIRIARPLSLGLPLPRDRRLKALCDALMANPADGRGLADWAEQVGASERTLARLFQSELDTSFGAWRQQLRLAKAVVEISRGLPMAEVASAVGYASQAAFSAMFSRALGVSPSRFGER
ncbi:helix-turn-helix transcriptional regulator [Zoogloea sp.]|uniref:AraC family transcriptional regulator n=1 Tax=Zoogloea sp. TaxID=49181 RepID=UPI0035B20A66